MVRALASSVPESRSSQVSAQRLRQWPRPRHRAPRRRAPWRLAAGAHGSRRRQHLHDRPARL